MFEKSSVEVSEQAEIIKESGAKEVVETEAAEDVKVREIATVVKVSIFVHSLVVISDRFAPRICRQNIGNS